MGRSTHFTASECLATIEFARLMERGEIPRFSWEYINPGDIEHGEWQKSPSWQKTSRVRTMRRVIEFHGPQFRVRMHLTGHQLETDDKTTSHWFIGRVERELRGILGNHPHHEMRTVWIEHLPERTDLGVNHLDVPRAHDYAIEFRKR